MQPYGEEWERARLGESAQQIERARAAGDRGLLEQALERNLRVQAALVCRRTASPDDAAAWLDARGVRALLREVRDLKVRARAESPHWLWHLATLLGEHDAAGALIEVAAAPLERTSPPRTRAEEYTFAVNRLRLRHPHDAPPAAPGPEGADAVYPPYLPLLADLSYARFCDQSLAAARAAFARRNADPAATAPDWSDGTGAAPARWDLRLEGIVRLAQRATIEEQGECERASEAVDARTRDRLRAKLAADPDDIEALKQLVTFSEGRDRYDALLTLVKRTAHLEIRGRNVWLMDLGDLARKKLKDPDAALAHYVAAFEAERDDRRRTPRMERDRKPIQAIIALCKKLGRPEDVAAWQRRDVEERAADRAACDAAVAEERAAQAAARAEVERALSRAVIVEPPPPATAGGAWPDAQGDADREALAAKLRAAFAGRKPG